jgi:hypothetical protein
LADLPDTKIKHRLLNAFNGRGNSVVNRIHESQHSRGQAWVAPDYVRNLRGVTLVGGEQFLERGVNAPQRGQAGTTLQPIANLLAIQGFASEL